MIKVPKQQPFSFDEAYDDIFSAVYLQVGCAGDARRFRL